MTAKKRSDDVLPPGKLPGDLLSRLLKTYRTASDSSVLIDASYGFDAAAISFGGETLLVKSDPITFTSTEAAQYLVAVNANDISCLGGIPRWMTVVALLPEGSTTAESVEQQFADIRRACDFEGISLIGGHTEITIGLDRPLLIGTLLGTVGANGLLEPGKGSVGDEIWISQSAAIEGTTILAAEREDELREAIGDFAVGHALTLRLDPGISVSRDARALLRTGVITGLHDATEGGVATAVHEIAGASGLGAEIDEAAIPVLESTQKICDHFGIDPLGLLSSGAMIITAKPGSEAIIRGSMVPLARIGVLTEDPDSVTIKTDNGIEDLPRFDSDEITRVLNA